MKKIISTLLIVSLLALTATADSVKQFTLGTGALAGSTATNISATVGAVSTGNASEITVQVSSTSLSADTANKIWVFNGSVDNLIWTSNVFTITYAGLGTTRASGITNLPPGYRYPYLQVFYVTNAAASVVMTNMTAKVFTKTGI